MLENQQFSSCHEPFGDFISLHLTLLILFTALSFNNQDDTVPGEHIVMAFVWLIVEHCNNRGNHCSALTQRDTDIEIGTHAFKCRC